MYSEVRNINRTEHSVYKLNTKKYYFENLVALRALHSAINKPASCKNAKQPRQIQKTFCDLNLVPLAFLKHECLLNDGLW